MKTKLKQYFPMLREREELLMEIRGKKELLAVFESWKEERQEEFLDFCTGVRGVKILYDAFFTEIFDPSQKPERMETFLGVLMEEKVKILQALPRESPRLADETSLLVMDIVVELENGSIVNVEMQKIGYAFPAQRSACYSADLMLRQYKRLRDSKEKKFSYRDIRTVYTIILFEKSPAEFHEFPEHYMHWFAHKSNTGLELDLMQKFLYIPLDIFKERTHNKSIRDQREAWLTFLSTDEPDQILRLLEFCPEFQSMYEEIYELCRNVERVMYMYSEMLRELDQNTVQYMIDEMQETINRLKAEVEQQKEEAEQQKKEAEQQKKEAEQQKKEAAQRQQEYEKKIADLESQLRRAGEKAQG